MFSIDALIVMYLPIIGEFIMANKFTIITVYYFLDKCAKYTDTTIDDNILTFLKNIFLRIIGKGSLVDQKFEYMKVNGLLNKTDPVILKKASKEFDDKIKTEKLDASGQLPIVYTDTPMPEVKPVKEDKVKML